MADIEIKCPHCANVLTLSEFADPDSVVCGACGKPLRSSQDPASGKAKLTLKSRAPDASSSRFGTVTPPDEKGHEGAAEKPITSLRPDTAIAKDRFNHHLASWAVFLVLGAAMGYLRYGQHFTITGAVNSWFVQLESAWGHYVVIVLHLAILLMAMKDSVFQGMLCLLVPFYSFYYLFQVSDNFYFRAVTGAILIGVGQDSIAFFQKLAIDTARYVQAWIESGG